MREASIGLLDNLVRNVTLGAMAPSGSERTDHGTAVVSVPWSDPQALTIPSMAEDEDMPAFAQDIDGAVAEKRRPATWLDALATDPDERPSRPGEAISAVNSDDAGLYRLFINLSP